LPDSSFVDTAKAVVDSVVAVPPIVGVDPASPIGKLLYPVIVMGLTALVRVIRPIYELNKTWSLRIAALVLGIANVWLIQGHPFSASTIVSGIALGAGAAGSWEFIGSPIAFKLKSPRKQAAEKALEEDK
jgi:hypothetical protein